MRLAFIFSRGRALACLSHLDMVRLFLRALRRSGLPVAYSQGFNPHPRFSLALPLPLGVTAGKEYGEVSFSEDVKPEIFITALAEELPEGLLLLGAFGLERESPALASLVIAACYTITPITEAARAVGQQTMGAAVEDLLARKEIIMQRSLKKGKTKATNVRPFIIDAAVESGENGILSLKFYLQAGSRGGVSPAFIIEQLNLVTAGTKLEAYHWQIHRDNISFEDSTVVQPMVERM